LRDFRTFFQDFLGLIVGGVASTALVLVTALLDLAPPWPPALVQLTALAQLIALIFVYQHFRRAGRIRTGRLMRRAGLVLAVFATFYLAGHSLLVFEMPNGEHDMRGLQCSADALAVYGGACPFLPTDLIAEAEFTADRLWTPLGLLATRLIMLAAWIVLFSSVVVLIGVFVVYQRRTPAD
jgi:hypothetical protein